MDVLTFAFEIVVPTVKEALSDRGNRRRVYVANIVTYSLIDYIAVGIGIARSDVCDRLRSVCAPAFEIVQSVCNGTKHGAFDTNPAMTATFLFSHPMCRAPAGVKESLVAAVKDARTTKQQMIETPAGS